LLDLPLARIVGHVPGPKLPIVKLLAVEVTPVAADEDPGVGIQEKLQKILVVLKAHLVFSVSLLGGPGLIHVSRITVNQSRGVIREKNRVTHLPKVLAVKLHILNSFSDPRQIIVHESFPGVHLFRATPSVSLGPTPLLSKPTTGEAIANDEGDSSSNIITVYIIIFSTILPFFKIKFCSHFKFFNTVFCVSQDTTEECAVFLVLNCFPHIDNMRIQITSNLNPRFRFTQKRITTSQEGLDVSVMLRENLDQLGGKVIFSTECLDWWSNLRRDVFHLYSSLVIQ
jgi:hypothetical protein